MKAHATRQWGGIGRARVIGASALAMLAVPVIAQHAGVDGHDAPDRTGIHQSASPRVSWTVPGESKFATLYATGKPIRTEWETVWRPMCGSRPDAMNQADLAGIAARWEQRLAAREAAGPGGPTGGGSGEGGIAGGGFNIIFNLDGSVPGAAIPAFAQVESYLEGLFDDDITIVIDVNFESMAPDILGATGSEFTKTSWPNSRAGLKNGMDSNDNIQNYLPTGSTIPVRYNGDTDVITNEIRVWWTRANFVATVGSVEGDAASMSFNSNISWDYDPSNGVVGESFRDVLVHECGHVLGFTSGADFRYKDMEALDIFRFQRTGGGHDYNPDTTAEFKVRPRLVSNNAPDDDVVVDVITVEYRMSDGDPYQAGHFREQSPSIGTMDPALANGETRYPDYFAPSDLKMFDAIGYDR